ncbi:MAG: PAS domain-containing protein [Alphaproteobacteria bacterium]|nr:PAS domain-containing protein [Rhodospirillales bacterium]MCW9046424.1 PAS domain-containing protein [Alphaproteobacteria bacterium]
MVSKAATKRNGSKLIVVGIGASAGGLEALKAFIAPLEKGQKIAYLIAQHMDPKHQSLLATLLGRETDLEVAEAVNDEKLVADRIYVCPSNKDMTLVGEKIILREPRHGVGPKPSVDMMFASLAKDFGDRAIGVILSGTGSDGSNGIRAIKAAGGINIAQDKESAKYDGMPVSAVNTGIVDLVLPPEEIAKELRAITVHYPAGKLLPPTTTPAVLSTYDQIMDVIKRRTKCDFSDYKTNTILRRIERRMATRQMRKIEEYAAFLENTTAEVELLSKDILISVTSFFRDKEAFAALTKVIKKIISQKQHGDPIRVWIPGCATGEEAYTIAIMFAQELGAEIQQYNIQFFATDLDGPATITGRKGIYSESSVADMDEEVLNRYFIRVGNQYEVVKQIREMVVFANHDLVRNPPFLRLDMVSCRNLFIYFNNDLQGRIFGLFHYVLKQNGYLFLGKSESIGAFTDLFTPIDKKWRIFARKGGFKQPLMGYSDPTVALPDIPRARRERDLRQTPESLMEKTLSTAFAPPSVIVDDSYTILHVSGDVRNFLTINPGKFGSDILSLVRGDIRPSLRAMLHKALRDGEYEAVHRIRISATPDSKPIIIGVRRVDLPSGNESYCVISFEQQELEVVENGVVIDVNSSDVDRVKELEQELTATREHLQTVVEELETSNEELQSLNEELQASNEELQSSNEELETSNEELQSTNEELTTVNEELQVKTGELAFANTDLANLRDSIRYPLIVVDRELRVMMFTAPTTNLFSIEKNDVGQVITSLPSSIDLPDIRTQIASVINGEKSHEQEIHVEDKLFWMLVDPYYDERRMVVGAVLSFLDRTEISEMQLKLANAKKEIERLGKVGKLFS